jgi:hypothetical protein
METLTKLVLDAFLAHWPKLKNDPTELAARLQRRQRAQLNRPPRAWCIALRAADTRLTPMHAITDDCHAYADRRPHTVTIDAKLVQRLCQPVRIEPPGEPWHDVAAKLGVHAHGLRRCMKNGLFEVRRILHLGGARGRPVPVLYTPRLLDPCARGFLPPGGYWGHAWKRRGDCVPADLHQAVRREPIFDDWPLNFRCWTWACPACDARADTLYLPLRVPYVEHYLQLGLPVADAEAAPDPAATFACQTCHRVHHLSRADGNSWNEFVTFLTCGLLYGREVPMPADWAERTNAEFKVARPRPAVRRNEVARLLAHTDLTRNQIARELNVRIGAVHTLVAKLYAQHGVHTRAQFRAHPAAPKAPVIEHRRIA